MVNYVKFSLIWTILALSVGISSQQTLPSPGNVYFIRSAADGLYLKNLGGGAVCEGFGPVILTTMGENPNDDFRWAISSPNNDTFGPVNILSIIEGSETFVMNELSMDDNINLCEPIFREFRCNPHAGWVMVQNARNSQCLSNSGFPGSSVAWTSCANGNNAQGWVFIGVDD